MKKVLKNILGPVIVISILLLFASIAFGADKRLGVGADVVHKPGMGVAELRYDYATALAWRNNYGLGGTYDVSRGRTEAGLGLIYVRNTDEDLGTNLNFLLRAGYCWPKYCLSIIHISHGSALGIEPDKANSGLNFLIMERKL